MTPAPWVVAGVVMATMMLLMVAAACDDGAGERTGSLPSPDASEPAPVDANTPKPTSTNTPAPADPNTPAPASTNTPMPADATTPHPPDKPVVNIQFIGGDDLSDESKASLADVIESIQASVVQIVVGSGSGSGFIVDEDGLVVTNAHVVAGERSVGVWLTNGRSYQGDVLERDETADLALVQIDGGGPFNAIAIGNPDGVRVGDEVLALGFPLADRIGTDLTVTRGIISSTRTVAGVELLQTDAAVNPGNSGGPLVNIDGEVIGVNTSRVEETDSGRPVSNIGFAVSVSELERRLPALGGRQLASPGTPTPAPALAPTPEPTWTAAPTFTPEPMWTPVPTFTPEPISTPTLTPTPTITPTPTFTPTPTITPTPTPTLTPTPTYTPTPTSTPTPTPTPIPPFVAVSSGVAHICGLRADGAAVCRGSDHYGQSSPPRGERFKFISSGGVHTCGLRDDGDAVCWGDNLDGQSSPPRDELFISISSGSSGLADNRSSGYGGHTCGLRDDGIAVCWGDDVYGQSSPPDHERFISISSGHGHTCGLRDDGFVICWGYDKYGQSSPPRDGRFTLISSGGFDRHIASGHTCGLRDDGIAVCWGAIPMASPHHRMMNVSYL